MRDSLIYGDDVKNKLLNYIYTTLLFSDANVDFNVVTWNRSVFLSPRSSRPYSS